MSDGGKAPQSVRVPFGHCDMDLSRRDGQLTWSIKARHGDGRPLLSGFLDGPDALTERGLIELSATIGAFVEGGNV